MHRWMRSILAITLGLAGILFMATGCGNQSASGSIDSSFPDQASVLQRTAEAAENDEKSVTEGESQKETVTPEPVVNRQDSERDQDTAPEVAMETQPNERKPSVKDPATATDSPEPKLAESAATQSSKHTEVSPPKKTMPTPTPKPKSSTTQSEKAAPSKDTAVPAQQKKAAAESPSGKNNALPGQRQLTDVNEKAPAGNTKAAAASSTDATAEEKQAPTTGVDPVFEKKDKNYKADNNKLTFGELYSEITVRGMRYSDKLLDLKDKEVVMEGYMAPPLGAEVDFFVLTKIPLSICPFCDSNSDWPSDIVVVYMPDGEKIEPTEHVVKVTGTLSVGSKTDDETGFVSLVRIEAKKVEVRK